MAVAVVLATQCRIALRATRKARDLGTSDPEIAVAHEGGLDQVGMKMATQIKRRYGRPSNIMSATESARLSLTPASSYVGRLDACSTHSWLRRWSDRVGAPT